MLDFLDGKYLVLSFCIGIFFVYVSAPAKQLVNKFPSPQNQNDLVYVDQSDSCYKYEASEVKCDGKSKPQPILEDFENSEKKHSDVTNAQ